MALAALAAGCGHQQQQHARDAHDLLVQAQQGLKGIHSGVVTIHARADTPIPLERTQTVPARNVPFSRLRLTGWTRNPHRVGCGPSLQCVRGDVDVPSVLSDLRPLLPPNLPVKPSSIHDAVVEIALRDRKPVYVKLTGNVDAGFLLENVPFQAELDLPRAR